jgi:hypothetical protein
MGVPRRYGDDGGIREGMDVRDSHVARRRVQGLNDLRRAWMIDRARRFRPRRDDALCPWHVRPDAHMRAMRD